MVSNSTGINFLVKYVVREKRQGAGGKRQGSRREKKLMLKWLRLIKLLIPELHNPIAF
jgi:hypothetical protein